MTSKETNLGKPIQSISVGDTFSVTESIKERDVMLYMGVTNDSNPAYLNQENTNQIPSVVPPIALMGVLTRTVSMHFPGPGSRLIEMNLNISEPIAHDSTITFDFEVIRVEELKQFITIHAVGYHAEESSDKRVLDAMLTVLPPEEESNGVETIDSGVFQRISGGNKFDY